MTLKERGREAFEAGDYQTAISMYATALQPETHCPPLERQILLSNMVAARLKIGGPGHVEAAVENAKQVSVFVENFMVVIKMMIQVCEDVKLVFLLLCPCIDKIQLFLLLDLVLFVRCCCKTKHLVCGVE